jgi:7-cyano-7-deazaguanine synthase
MNYSAVVVISGGLDSSTLLHRMATDYSNYDLHGISFDYGQRHKKELEFAAFQCEQVGATHRIVDMSFIGELFAQAGSRSSLISDEEVPEGHYGEASMSQTVVPNRNMIMMSLAAGYAVSLGARIVATGVHAGDHFIYPDCRPSFFEALSLAIYKGNEGFIPKTFEIAAEAFELNVDIAHTWSCYKGGDIHCGKCGTCVERLEAIASTGNEDPTAYEDSEFYLEALKRATV